MRAISFMRGSVGVACSLVLAAACSDFNGVAPAVEEAGSANDAGEEGAPVVTGTGGDPDSGPGNSKDSGGTDASTWSPKELAGLSVWLDSSVGLFDDGAGNISSWKDQSGQANNALVLQPCYDTDLKLTACRAPVRAPATLNGRDTVRFDLNGKSSSFLSIADSTNVQFGTGDFAVFVVARYRNQFGITQPASDGDFWLKGTVTVSVYNGVSLSANTLSSAILSVAAGDSAGGRATASGATAGLNDNAFRRYGASRRSTSLEAWVNGNLDGKASLAAVYDVSAAGIPVHIGGPFQGFGGGLIGDIAEVVAVKGTVSDPEIAKLDAYFKAKWAL